MFLLIWDVKIKSRIFELRARKLSEAEKDEKKKKKGKRRRREGGGGELS